MTNFQARMAFRTITNLTEGASAFQQSYLPGWKGKNANSLEENGIVFTDTLASWIKKGFVSVPFFFDPVEDFRSNTMQIAGHSSERQSSSCYESVSPRREKL